MGIELSVRWKTTGENRIEIDPRLLSLLKGIRDTGSLKAAAEQAAVSYRFAWGLVRHWGEYFGSPLAKLTKGKGATLSVVGEKLLWAEQAVGSRLAYQLKELTQEINMELESVLNIKPSENRLSVYASNGLAIAELDALCQKSTRIHADFQFRGSLDSLRQLATSNCDIAGFHFPTGALSLSLAPHYQQWLDEDRHILLHVATRQQGLIFQAENPLHIKSLRDLAKRSLRFVNRQKQSGTRTIFDGLLKQEGMNKREIKGYYDEEFTHLAVAAMVASGAADAGFGIKAAASKFKLGFIPVVDETYALAISKLISSEVPSELKKILASKNFKTRVGALPGYNTWQSGKQIEFTDLL